MVKRIKLTPKNRLKIYEKALEDFDITYQGLCLRLRESTEFYQDGIFDKRSYRKMHQCFPEIYQYKPKKMYYNQYWFDFDEKGINKRKTILKKAIKEVKSKINELK